MKINPLNILKGLGASFIIAISLIIAINIFDYSNSNQITGSLTNDEDSPIVYLIKEVEPDLKSPHRFFFDYYNGEYVTIIKDNDQYYLKNNLEGLVPLYGVIADIPITINEFKTSDPKGLSNYTTKHICFLQKNTIYKKILEGNGGTFTLTPAVGQKIICIVTNTTKKIKKNDDESEGQELEEIITP